MMKCEAEQGNCSENAKYMIHADFTPDTWEPLRVCQEHFDSYCAYVKSVSLIPYDKNDSYHRVEASGQEKGGRSLSPEYTSGESEKEYQLRKLCWEILDFFDEKTTFFDDLCNCDEYIIDGFHSNDCTTSLIREDWKNFGDKINKLSSAIPKQKYSDDKQEGGNGVPPTPKECGYPA